jgi:hypothetical protein
MPFVFANPWGLLGLLAIPAVLAIHFLQRRTKTIPVSTLFLIERRRERARMGRRFERLISSVPLWLQLLAALLLAAVLAQPRLPAADSVVRLAVVVDESASMRAFKPDLLRELAALAERHRSAARRIEWLVLPSNPARPRLYAGASTADLLAALDLWQPVEGAQDPRPALRLARQQVGLDGTVCYATDTPLEQLPADAVLLAVGRPLANVGCTGVTVAVRDGAIVWQALLANRGTAPVSRRWHLEWDGGGRTEPAVAEIPAGGSVHLHGTLPEGAMRLCLALEADDFDFDDRFPFLAPAPKPLRFAALLSPRFDGWLARLTRAVPGLAKAAAGETPDLTIAADATGAFPAVVGPAILMSSAEDAGAKTLADPVAAIRHPLVNGLAWDALSVQTVPMLPSEPDDTVLVWAGKTPLVSLSPPAAAAGTPAARQGAPRLVLHFNPNQSNWERLPAGAVLLLRFCEEVRLAKRAAAREQLEPRQELAPLLPPDPREDWVMETLDATGAVTASRVVPRERRGALVAPDEPGFLRVREGPVTLLEGAVAFADAREGDFRGCAARVPEAGGLLARRSADALAPWWPLVFLLVLAMLLAAWAYAAREQRAADSAAASPVPF